MIGAQTDITVEQNLQEKLNQGETKFKAAFEHSSLGIAFAVSTVFILMSTNNFATY
jgi:hypothetical protein